MLSDKNYISFGWISAFWERVKKYISDAIQPSGDKEVISVLTASGTAPANPSDGDFWLDTTNVRLKEWSVDVWVSHDPLSDVIYITADTAHMYVYKDDDFVDVTGEVVDNTIYVNNLSELDDFTDTGLFLVCLAGLGIGAAPTYYTMQAWVTHVGVPPRLRITRNQKLYNCYGYKSRSKVNDGAWSEWDVFEYASLAQLDAETSARNAAIEQAKEDLLPLIYAGL